MKKLKFLLVVLMAFLVLPISVFAEDGSTDEATNNEVNLYFFHGDGCPHCEEAQEWFDEIEEEYGDKFNLVSYEVWYNQENNDLMAAVAEARGETADGVPYIIVGNQSWSGFDESYKEDILAKIESDYSQDVDERYDIKDYVSLSGNFSSSDEESTGRDVLITIVILAIGGAVIAGVMFARKSTN